jgi:hypothetical protein
MVNFEGGSGGGGGCSQDDFELGYDSRDDGGGGGGGGGGSIRLHSRESLSHLGKIDCRGSNYSHVTYCRWCWRWSPEWRIWRWR